MTDNNLLPQAAQLLHGAHQVAVLTGAGVSRESGVPTFRDALDGLWAQYDPEQLATPAAFLRNPRLVWNWYEYRRAMVREARPNPGHLALAQLEQHFPALRLITQNVDDLHEQAGSSNVVHLHGNIARSRCFDNCQGDPTLIDVAKLTYDAEAGPPLCPHCGSYVRPDVVWFGEMLPADAIQDATIAARLCDIMLVVGTSGMVTPAATLPQIAQQHGAKVIEVNPDNTPITAIAAVKLSGPSGEVLPQLVALLSADA